MIMMLFCHFLPNQAGIPTEQLSLALEPESAAIFCKEQALNRVGGVDGVFLRAFDPGEKYIVVDCGGTRSLKEHLLF